MKKNFFVALALLGAPLLTGCDVADLLSGVGVPGTFSATVAGDLTSDLTGAAVFGAQEMDGDTAFVVSLVSADSIDTGSDFKESEAVVFIDPTTSSLETGSHQVLDLRTWYDTATVSEPEQLYAAYMTRQIEESGVVMDSRGGRLTIDEAESDELVGSFEVPASVIVSSNSSVDTFDVQITGTFHAMRGDPDTRF